MKQRIFSLLAAMLLMSVSAMAQSGNNETIRGDVNGDGVVNGTDIQEVINIIVNGPDEGETTYYWYVGYDQDAYENPQGFKNNMYTTTTTQYTKIGNNGLDISTTGTMPNYLIMIIPTTWEVPIIYDKLAGGIFSMTLEKQNQSITGLPGTYNIWSGTGEISNNIVWMYWK